MEDNKNYKLERIIDIKNNEYLSNFINANNLDNTFLMDHFSTFNDCLSSIELCHKCKGLNDCKQAKKGEVINIAFDQILSNEISYCPYYVDELNRQKLIKSYIYSDVPEMYSSLNLENIKVDEDDARNLFVHVYQIAQGNTTKGLYIYGDLGVGKTYMCIALANSLVLNGKKVAFIKTNNFVTEMANLNRIDPEKYSYTINKIKKCDYIILDDIGSEIVTEFVRDRLLIDLLDYRMENKLCTIFTSNLDKNSLLKHYANNQESIKARRLMERIDILSDDFCLDGVNKRRINL